MANWEEPAALKWVVPLGSAEAALRSATEQTRKESNTAFMSEQYQ